MSLYFEDRTPTVSCRLARIICHGHRNTDMTAQSVPRRRFDLPAPIRILTLVYSMAAIFHPQIPKGLGGNPGYNQGSTHSLQWPTFVASMPRQIDCVMVFR